MDSNQRYKVGFVKCKSFCFKTLNEMQTVSTLVLIQFETQSCQVQDKRESIVIKLTYPEQDNGIFVDIKHH